MMVEYIDKEDAVGVIADWAEDTRVRVDSDHGQIYQRCIRLIRDLPTADVISKDDLNKVLSEIDGQLRGTTDG